MKTHSTERGLEALRRAGAAVPLLSANEELGLARRARRGDQSAVDQLAKAHVRFVFSIADQYSRYGIAFEELVAEGLLGLMEAVRRFDPERGTRLATYASFWVRALLRRYTLNHRRIVRPPATRAARKVIGYMSETRRALAQKAGHEPDASAIAEALGVARSDVEDIQTALHWRDAACDVPSELGGYEPVCSAPSPEAQAEAHERQAQDHAAVQHALLQLSDRERLIISQRALQNAPRRLEDIGSELGLSRERVRQIQEQGLAKLRRRLQARELAVA
jgi:alternative sigma factor RpoH